MIPGDRVRVSALSAAGQTADGTVVLCSANGHSLAISFGEDHVPFFSGATGMALHPDHGKMLLLSLMDDSWSDVFSGRRFRVSPLGGSGAQQADV